MILKDIDEDEDIARNPLEKVEVAESCDRDGEDHRAVHPAHRALHPHRGGVHQPLHLPPHHMAHGGGWLSRCNSWVMLTSVIAVTLSLKMVTCHKIQRGSHLGF